MISTSATAAPPDAGLVHFEVRDGIRRVRFNVSDEALEAVSGLAAPSTATLRRRSFDRFRTLIETAAKLKLKTLPPGFVGPVALSSGDLRCVPPEVGVPAFGSNGRAA